MYALQRIVHVFFGGGIAWNNLLLPEIKYFKHAYLHSS